MLETVNLVKVYKTKGGTQVNALDGVSLRFPEKGMVFLLGKSGSGKSTLLNVCGGLDSPTEGEIIVKGRSSKTFTQSDFDSYRNTFIGFVFQEYNILNEFSVEDNIALALELQGKPKDKATIDKILADVDLSGYAKRKPNTLSGGQKQRIAIARALVKNPEIIMADEPTGALDSTTGKQVFDTLKKLSQNKLVLVVSHDRDFAEQYGDRVIELKDGKVISDVSKTNEKSRDLGNHLAIAGDTLCVKAGVNLTDEDFLQIKNFLSSSKNGAVLASGESDMQNFKQIARISNDGSKEVFKKTEEPQEKRTYSQEESQFIRSRLPARHALKMGVSGLKIKPIRLFFTIFLCTIAFIMFGLLSTMMVYDNDKVLKTSLMASDYTSLHLKKQYKSVYKQYQNNKLVYTYSDLIDTQFTKNEVENFTQKFGSKTIGARSIRGTINAQISGIYFSSSIEYAFSAADAKNLTLVQGVLPQKDDEICLSVYTAESLMSGDIYNSDTNNFFTIENIAQLVGKNINFRNSSFTISGIWQSDALPKKYDDLKADGEDIDYSYRHEFETEREAGNYMAAIFSDTYLKSIEHHYEPPEDIYNNYFTQRYRVNIIPVITNYNNQRDSQFSSFESIGTALPMYFIDPDKTQLAQNEVILGSYFFNEVLEEAVTRRMDQLLDEDVESQELGQEIFNKYYYDSPVYDSDTDTFYTKYSINSLLSFAISNTDINNNSLTKEQRLGYFKEVFDFLTNERYGLTLSPLLITELYGNQKNITANIVGILIHENTSSKDVVFSSEDYELFKTTAEDANENNGYFEIITAYVTPKDALYDAIFIAFDKSDTMTSRVVSLVDKFAEDDSVINLDNLTADNVNMVNSLVKNFSSVFLWVGLVLAVFSALLLCNFISISISHKKKEIGILRAVGARSFDVFKIFFSESFVIALFCVVLSVIGGIVVCNILNQKIGDFLSNIALFVFGAPSIFMVIGVAFLTAVIATFLPVYLAAKKKPVESIRAL